MASAINPSPCARKFSRHVEEQYRWGERLRALLRENLDMARICKSTQAAYLKRREEIRAKETRLTRETRAYVEGYLRAMEEIQLRALIHVYRIEGRPETASAAKWDDMTEELRQACREHRTESCLAWDDKGAHPYSEWTHN